MNSRKELSYRGNTSLKKPGAKIEFTPELIEEYIKCKNDIIYFAEHYFKIVTEKGLVLIKLRDYQKEMIKSMSENRFTISNQSRQSGKSETFRIFLTHYILFNEYKTVAILANKGDTSREILSKLQLSYQALPAWLQLGVIDFNKGSFTLENNSRIIATSTSKNSARGFTAHCIVLDEMAFIENFAEFYAAVFPVISAGEETKIIITSTPNGINHFYDFWKGAIENKNGFYPIFVPWDKVPGRDIKWKTEILKGLNNDLEKFSAEFECEFLGSSGTLISGWKLKQIIGSQKQPLFKTNDINLKMYEKPIKENSYIIIADVSRGKGLDYSAFSVIDVSDLPYKQICTFRDNQIAPADYADIIYKTAKLYNNASVLTEINDIGEQIGYILLIEYGYENVLCTENSGKSGKKISFGGKKSDKGIRTTKIVKNIGCSTLKLLIEQDKLICYDEETINEFASFSRKKLSYEAEPGKHDDMVMCLVLFAWLTDQQYFKEMTNINTSLSLRERSNERINNDLLPFGFINSISPPKNYAEYHEDINMNIPFKEYVEDIEIGKKIIIDNCQWEIVDYKMPY
jgi:hypothetical protein